VRAELVSIGEAFDDFIFYDLPRLPRPGEELKTSRFARVPGGGAITTAVTAARLGISTRVVSGLSDAGRAWLKNEGIAFRDLRRPDERAAITVAISTGRDRSFVTYNGVNDVLEPRLLDLAARLRPDQVPRPHVHCAFYPARCRRWVPIVRQLKTRGFRVSWDFGWNAPMAGDAGLVELVRELSLVFVNEAEARLYSRQTSRASIFAWWRRTASATVIKLGRRGAACLSPDGVVRAPAIRVHAVDTTGAGDAFNGGFLAAYLRGRDIGACLRAGNRSGARATKRAGGS
jgi:sugar/nucleoside kinase (ribokinase family)